MLAYLVDKLIGLAMGAERGRAIGGAEVGDDIKRVATDRAGRSENGNVLAQWRGR